jgi:hypothetical protein
MIRRQYTIALPSLNTWNNPRPETHLIQPAGNGAPNRGETGMIQEKAFWELRDRRENPQGADF